MEKYHIYRKLPTWKRIFDIAFALVSLLLLSPLFLIIAALIKLESKGPVFYTAKRVGTAYRIFKFYKFRSMRADADKKVDTLMSQNAYTPTASLVIAEGGDKSGAFLFGEGEIIPEGYYLLNKLKKQDNSFFKIANDSRITRVGKFLRNTSHDELPQLFNILKGDMSVVGNRPLPLYEAETLTSDQWIERFLAPAGLTGLWQVSKRGKLAVMSADERKQLDIEYARNYSFFYDLKIIFRTPLALFQHENV